MDQGSHDYGYMEGGSESDRTLMTVTSDVTDVSLKSISYTYCPISAWFAGRK